MAAYIYITANKRNGTLYTGVTSDLIKRIYEHKHGITKGFAAKYGCKMLVYYEIHSSIGIAIEREKEIKHFKRQWKLELIEKMNPHWNDLYDSICQ